jgi:hypothetical protein
MKTIQTLHKAKLINHCPTCFATDGLELVFTQEKTHSKFYEKVAKEINYKMYCHSCNNQIYPVNWTDDIERVYEYNRKLAKPSNTGIKLKPLLLYSILLVAIIIVAAIMYVLIR